MTTRRRCGEEGCCERLRQKSKRRVVDIWGSWATHVFWSVLLVASGGAWAGLPQGTPNFTCVPPTTGFDDQNNTYTLPASGGDALKEFHFYLDPPPLVVIGGRSYIAGGTPAKAVRTVAQGCGYQTIIGEISIGSHTMRVTAVDNTLRESPASNAVSFTVPAPAILGPNAPSSLQVQ